MIKKFTLTIFVVFVFIANSQAEIWNDAEGLKKLERSKFKNDFYQLVNFYQPQENPLFCGIATTTMIRNALDYGNISSQKTGEVANSKGGRISYNLYSQKDFFNDQTEIIKKRAVIELKEPIAGTKIFDAGLSLGDFVKMLQVHNLQGDLTRVEKNDAENFAKFRQILQNVLSEKSAFLVANFDGKVLGKATRGHFSPIVAYDEESDSVLVMDVALHKNQWYWVAADKIFAAMNTKDGDNYRGYVVVKKN